MRIAVALVCVSFVAGCATPPAPVEVVEVPRKVVVAKKPVTKKAVAVAAKPVAPQPLYTGGKDGGGGGSGWQ